MRGCFPSAGVSLRSAVGARESFLAAVRSAPQDGKAHFNLGAVLAERQEFAEAEANFEVAVLASPTDAEARSSLEMARGKNREAL